jgi:hypothetical protein
MTDDPALGAFVVQTCNENGTIDASTGTWTAGATPGSIGGPLVAPATGRMSLSRNSPEAHSEGTKRCCRTAA